MIQWILEHLGIVVVIVLFVVQMIRGVLQQARNASERQRETRRDEGAEERRVREVQEQVRRQIAARRAGQSPVDTPPRPSAPERPLPRAETTQMPDFGGPFGRMLEELQRRAQPPPPTPPVLVESGNTAELDRQQRLADELKAAEEVRRTARRRAAHRAEQQASASESEPALRLQTRDQLLADLSETHSLRRAFLLREVLGAPVGLR